MENMKKDPFSYTFDEFVNLSDEDRDHVFDQAEVINADLAESFFADNPGKDWLVIIKRNEVFISGIKNNDPLDEILLALSEKLNCPVFTYSRPAIIENINSDNNEQTEIRPLDDLCGLTTDQYREKISELANDLSYSKLDVEKYCDDDIFHFQKAMF
jgi:hypothetical protein